jgi:hypothetical protein
MTNPDASTEEANRDGTTDEVILGAFRHDVHKFTGESHDDAREDFAGVPVNRSVPEGADGDAAALSRPKRTGKPTVPTHQNHFRLSLLTGETVAGGVSRATIQDAVADLVATDDAQIAHERWLASDVAALFNESVYHPYTSLKYHTLLVVSLLDVYRAGHAFSDLHLVVDSTGALVPYRTVFIGERFALRVDVETDGCPAARMGERPRRSWASTWARLSDHPLRTDRDKWDMILDANCRRIRAWSTALQYLEDFAVWRPTR